MIFLAEMSDGIGWITGLPGTIELTAAGRVLAGIYIVCLLAGLALDIIWSVRWLAARRVTAGLGGAPAVITLDRLPRIAQLKGRPWTWREAVLILMVLLAAQLAIRGAFWLGRHGGGALPDSTAWAVLWQGLAFHGVGMAVIAWSIHRRRISWASAFGMRWKAVIHQTGQGVLGYLAILPPVLVVSVAYQLVLFYYGYPLSIQNVILFFLEPQSVGMQVCLLGLTLILAPLTEEALFRGIALPLLARAMGLIPAVMLTAACFALMHFHVPALAPLFVLASGFAIAYSVTGSLWVPVVMHALFNSMNVGLVLLGTAH